MFWFGEENLTCLLTGGLAVLSLVNGVSSLVGLNIPLPGGLMGLVVWVGGLLVRGEAREGEEDLSLGVGIGTGCL